MVDCMLSRARYIVRRSSGRHGRRVCSRRPRPEYRARCTGARGARHFGPPSAACTESQCWGNAQHRPANRAALSMITVHVVSATKHRRQSSPPGPIQSSSTNSAPCATCSLAAVLEYNLHLHQKKERAMQNVSSSWPLINTLSEIPSSVRSPGQVHIKLRWIHPVPHRHSHHLHYHGDSLPAIAKIAIVLSTCGVVHSHHLLTKVTGRRP